jgi:cytochrome c oxidase cbb3-type subunit 3
MRNWKPPHVGTLPFASVLLLGLTLWGARIDAQETENPFAGQVDIRIGERLFEAQCSNCHGLAATGNPEAGGPDLTTGRFRTASTDAGLFRVIRDGIRGTAMIGINRNSSDQAVWQVVTYLDSLNPADSLDNLPGSATAGRQLFEGQGDCARCHIVNGEGGRLGPDLSQVGERRPQTDLRSDVTDPNAEVDPRWWTLTVTRQDGSVVRGLRMHEDSFSLRLMDEQESLRSFEKSQIRSFERDKNSTMPAYTSLTATELDDLATYLLTLRRER